MKKNILKILNIIYLLFSIYLIIINFYRINIFTILSIIIVVMLIYILIKKDYNFLKNKNTFKILFFIGILLRILMIFINSKNILGDYSFFYNSSIRYANNLELNNNYIALFPFLYPYIFLLGNLMKLLGTKYITVIIFNTIIDIIGLLFLYLLTKKNENNKKYILIYMLNPFNIIWNTICCPVIVVNTLYIIILYIIDKLKNTNKIFKKIILSIILGITMSVSNSFRPIIIILIIALIIWIIFDIINNKDKKIILYSVITLITYISINFSINIFISNNIDIKVPTSKSGWSIYLGSNYEASGSWNINDSEYLNMIDNENKNLVHNTLLKKGIERYKENGFKNIILLIKKSVILGNDIETYTKNEFLNLIDNKINIILKVILNLSISIFWYFLLITNLLVAIKNIKENNNKLIIPIGIYTIGFFIASLLVEVSPRYFMPLLIPILLYSFNIFKNKPTRE